MMTEGEIAALKSRVKAGGVSWRDSDGNCRPVIAVSLQWVEFEEEPDLAEPAALLAGGGAVALLNVSADQFVTLTAAI